MNGQIRAWLLNALIITYTGRQAEGGVSAGRREALRAAIDAAVRARMEARKAANVASVADRAKAKTAKPPVTMG